MASDFQRMGKFHLAWFQFFTNRFLAGYYRRFVQSLGLLGNEQVLELGSGTGAASVFLADALRKGGHLISTDISIPMQNAAKQALAQYANVEFRLGDVTLMELPERSLDLILIHFVLHDIPKSERLGVLRTARRILRPEGRLILREPVAASHGMPEADLDRIAQESGFKSLRREVGRISWWRPRAYTGFFVPLPSAKASVV